MRVQVSLSVWLVALLSLGWAATPAQGGDREGWVAGLPGVGSSSSEPGRPPILRLLQEDSSNTTGFGFSVNGCKCLTACDTSFDSLIPWCTTSEIGVLREEVLNPCGQFSQRRSSYWDECVVNVTSVDHLAETFDQQWELMVLTATSSTMSVFFLAGARALFSMCNVLHKVWWLPLFFVFWGGVLSSVFSSLTSLIIAQVYLAIPYAIPQSFAIALGATQAAVLCYWQLARGFTPASM